MLEGTIVPTLPRVFVVDNEPVIADSLTAILNLSGLRAAAFTNPLRALQQAAAEEPNLLITDVRAGPWEQSKRGFVKA